MISHDNAYSGSHPLLDTRVISWKYWVRRCFGVYFRTTPHDPPQQLDTAPTHRVYRVPCCLMKPAACCFWKGKCHTTIDSKWTIQTYFEIATQQPSPSSTNYFLDARNATTSAEPRATQPLPLSPAQLVLTIQSHQRDWMPLLTPPTFLYSASGHNRFVAL